MGDKKISLRTHNFPGKVHEAVQNAADSFLNDLKKVLDSYEFLFFGGIKKLGCIVFYNGSIADAKSICYGGNLHLVLDELPENASAEQRKVDTAFRARLALVLTTHQHFPSANIERVVVVLTYNRGVDEIDVQFSPAPPASSDGKESSSTSFVVTRPKYTMSQVILGAGVADEISKAIALIKYRHTLYEEWGFKEIDPRPKAVISLYGPSGTGKTMASHAIAAEVGGKILALNYADIESKFVGEAPKNLVKAFNLAAQEKAVLFFDEADSFLGKRISNVSSGSDQAINSFRSQMLILLDDFDGIVIFATNLVKNYDKAFDSRIFKHLEFSLPDRENRKKIIGNCIPSKIPFEEGRGLSEDDVDELAEISDGFSGRDIKNAVLEALTFVLSEGRSCAKVSDFISGFVRAKDNKDKLQSAQRDGPEINKEALEKKIQQAISGERSKAVATARASVHAAMHAAFADGGITERQKSIIDPKINEFKLGITIPDGASSLPAVEELLAKLPDASARASLFEFVVEVLVADGSLSDKRRAFLQSLCAAMGMGGATAEQAMELVAASFEKQERWVRVRGLIEKPAAHRARGPLENGVSISA